MRNVQKLVVILLILLLTLSACSQELAPVTQEPETGLDHGSVRIIQEDGGPSPGGVLNLFMTNPDTLNPLTTKNPTVRHLSSFVFDALFIEASEGDLKNGLVDSYTFSDDALIVDIVLKDNILFHDGGTLTADDVAFTIQSIKEAGARSFYYDYVSSIDSVKTVTRLGLRMVLKEADSEILNKLTFPIVPRHVFKDWPIEGHSDSMKLIGTGPFKFKAYEEGEIALLRNDSWWYLEDPQGLSHPIWLDGISFMVYPDESYRMEAFQKQVIDIAYMEEGHMEGYAQRTDLYFKQYESNILEFLAISPVGTENSPVSQGAFRSILLNYLMGYESLIPVKAGKLVLPEGMSEMGNSRGDTLKSLLEAGFSYDQEKNVLTYQKNGIKIPVKLSLKYNGLNGERKSVSQWVTNALFEIGIQVNADNTTPSEQQALVLNGRYDLMLLGCRIPYYTDIQGALKLASETLKMSGQPSTLLPLYRLYGAVLYQNNLRGPREPVWKNIYNGWTEWYLVQKQ